jgi:diadenosine tetraphosphate (Ap4A) HIT family hydrolase/HKD family nuclease
MSAGCPFCDPDPSRVFHEGKLVLGLWDAFPVSPGHALIVPRRHVATWFDASDDERTALNDAIAVARAAIESAGHRPDGYNVGFNVGEAAGQTVPHLHVHVIPRYRGDMEDPRGGVRHVIPSKGNYLRGGTAGSSGPGNLKGTLGPLATGGEADPFSRHVLPLFDWARQIAIVSAFVQESGLRRIGPAVDRALGNGARIRLVTGDYLDITQVGALEQLLDWQNASCISDDEEDDSAPRGRLEARVVEVDQLPGRTRAFHPKSWRFWSEERGTAFVGSSNLSLSALDTGIEWNLRIDRANDPEAYKSVGEAFEALWSSSRTLTAEWIEAYAARTRQAAQPLPVGEVETTDLERCHDPHGIQVEALAKLRESRANGHRRALVVMATGLGKTWLAALDYRQFAGKSAPSRASCFWPIAVSCSGRRPAPTAAYRGLVVSTLAPAGSSRSRAT